MTGLFAIFRNISRALLQGAIKPKRYFIASCKSTLLIDFLVIAMTFFARVYSDEGTPFEENDEEPRQLDKTNTQNWETFNHKEGGHRSKKTKKLCLASVIALLLTAGTITGGVFLGRSFNKEESVETLPQPDPADATPNPTASDTSTNFTPPPSIQGPNDGESIPFGYTFYVFSRFQ